MLVSSSGPRVGSAEQGRSPCPMATQKLLTLEIFRGTAEQPGLGGTGQPELPESFQPY